jgi:N-acyl-D-aspartate/D-glutamate deacylase
MLDLVIRNGTVIDGSGAAGRRADVGVRDGRVVVVGETDESAAATVDADGLVVTPGFVDPHTHYDAQLFWDPAASPSSLHGVTSIVAGNCGFTLAPLHDRDADYTRRMMAKVEGMPLAALEQGVPWSWSTFAEYLDAIDGNIGVNVGVNVGHCALRRHVMGAGAVGAEATTEQLDAMTRLLHEALDAGGLGFSTTLAFTHSDGDGEAVASRWASRDEVLALCGAVRDHEGTTLEYVTDGCMRGFRPDEVDLMADMTLAGRRPLNWNVLTVDSKEPERYREQLAACENAAAMGGSAVALTMPVLVEMNMSFNTYCAFFMLPDWGAVMNLPVPERIQRLGDPAVRAHLLERSRSSDAGVFTRLTEWGQVQDRRHVLAGQRGPEGQDRGRHRGRARAGAVRRAARRRDRRRPAHRPVAAAHRRRSRVVRLRAEAWARPDVLLGGSDAGAHLDRMCGAPYTTEFLGTASAVAGWCRSSAPCSSSPARRGALRAPRTAGSSGRASTPTSWCSIPRRSTPAT